VTQAWDKVPGT